MELSIEAAIFRSLKIGKPPGYSGGFVVENSFSIS
jgi:hypothetical protein